MSQADTGAPEQVIRLATLQPVILTVEEYDRLASEVRGRVLADDAGLSDLICLRLLEEHAPRYHDILREREARRRAAGDPLFPAK